MKESRNLLDYNSSIHCTCTAIHETKIIIAILPNYMYAWCHQWSIYGVLNERVQNETGGTQLWEAYKPFRVSPCDLLLLFQTTVRVRSHKFSAKAMN